MNINLTDLNAALTVMWQGMAGIFAVMAVIALIVFCFTRLSSRKK